MNLKNFLIVNEVDYKVAWTKTGNEVDGKWDYSSATYNGRLHIDLSMSVAGHKRILVSNAVVSNVITAKVGDEVDIKELLDLPVIEIDGLLYVCISEGAAKEYCASGSWRDLV